VKELFQGRRFGFAPRAAIAYVAIGIGISLTLSDLMAWFAWGGNDTNGYVVVADWLAHAVTVVLGLAALAALAEYLDVPEDDRGIARLDLIAAVAANLYSAREWEELEEEPMREHRPRRRAVSR